MQTQAPCMRLRRSLVLTLTFLVACTRAPANNDGKLKVVATVSPITNIVENVAGDLVNLVGLVPEGVNSHTFEPAPSDAKLLREADIIFLNGLHLEEPTRELAEANLKKGAQIVLLGDKAITKEEWIFDFSFPEEDGDPNPHLWTNPVYAKRFSEIVMEVLESADPDHAAAYENQARFAQKVDAFDAALRSATATVPPANRKLLTYHDSFPYFAREYGWSVVGAIQPSDFAEPTAREVAGLIDQIKRERVPAIFGSEVFPSPVLEQIAKESGARYVDDLRDDDLPGNAGDEDHSYLGLMRFDFTTIVEALGGNAALLRSVDISTVTDGHAKYRT